MPNIRGQAVLTDGFEIDTTEYGKRKVTFLELGGNSVRLTFFLNDVQVSQQDLSNPSLTTIYTTVAAGLFPGAPIEEGTDNKTIKVDGSLYVSWHLIQRNPLQLLIIASNEPPPVNWWQS